MLKLEPNSIIKKIFGILVLLSMFFLILGQRTVKENDNEHHQYAVLEGEWERIMPDGQRIAVDVPGNTPAARKEVVVIETTLPAVIPPNYSICVRSSQQDLKILVGGEVRKNYSTRNQRLFGKNSMSKFIFAPLKGEDAGKKLQIRMVTDSRFTGKLNRVYWGREIALQFHFIQSYMLENILAICMMALSMTTIITGTILQIAYHKNISLQYLGWGIFIVSFWILAESRIRQFFVPNNTLMGIMAYVCVTLIPIPFAIYIDEMQSLRYHKFYMALNGCCVVVFIFNTFLQFTNTLDYLDTLWMAKLLMVVGIVFAVITIFIDYWKRNMREYKLLFFSIMVLVISGIIEYFLSYHGYVRYGICICAGIAFTLIMATVFTAKQIRTMEDERRSALKTNQLKSEFLLEISQRIRVPLNTIIKTDELILNREKDPELKDYLIGIQRTGYQIQSMIDDIFDYTLIEMDKLNLLEDSYSVQSLIEKISTEAKMKCADKDLNFETYIDNKMPAVLFGDVVRIQQCVFNLLHHAIQHTKEGDIQLSVSGKRNEEKKDEYNLIIRIEDTGIGLSEADIGMLYKSFNDHKKREKGEDIELGLALSKNLTDFMGGKFIIQSIFGQGTSFIMEIPQKMSGDYNTLWMMQKEEIEKEENTKVDLGIGREKLMSYCGDDVGMFYHVLEIFCKKAKEYQEQLERIQESQERKEYLYVLHSLKGSAMTIAAEGFCTLIYEQEKLVQEADSKHLFDKFPIFYQSFLQVVEEAHSILQERENGNETEEDVLRQEKKKMKSKMKKRASQEVSNE